MRIHQQSSLLCVLAALQYCIILASILFSLGPHASTPLSVLQVTTSMKPFVVQLCFLAILSQSPLYMYAQDSRTSGKAALPMLIMFVSLQRVSSASDCRKFYSVYSVLHFLYENPSEI